jgi:hypothetical protein
MKTFSNFVNYTTRIEPVMPGRNAPKLQDQTVNIRQLTYTEFVQQVIDQE